MNACPQHQSRLALFAAGVLDAPECRVLQAHLAGCPGCRDSLRELREICREHSGVIGATPLAVVSPGFHQRLVRRLRDGNSTGSRRSAGWIPPWLNAWRWPLALTIGAAVAALILGLWSHTFVMPPAPLNSGAPSLARRPAVDSPATLLAYRRAAGQSPEALEALLAHEAARPSATTFHVTAFTRDLPALTD